MCLLSGNTLFWPSKFSYTFSPTYFRPWVVHHRGTGVGNGEEEEEWTDDAKDPGPRRENETVPKPANDAEIETEAGREAEVRPGDPGE